VAWVAAHLPIWSNYRRTSTSGPDRLEGLPCEIDPQGQLCLVPLLVRDLGRDGVHGLLDALLRRLGGDDSERALPLRLPPPNPQLAEIVAETLGGQDGAAPQVPRSPDKRRLWLLMAALALLPDVFRKQASFSINETRAPIEPGPDAPCAITVLRKPALQQPLPVRRPWIEFCIAHGESRNLEGLRRIQSWLSSALARPSVDGLEPAFRFFQALVEPAAGSSPISAGDVAGILREMAPFGCYDAGRLLADVRLFEQRFRPTAHERMGLYKALATVAVHSGNPGHDELVRAVVDCLQPDEVLSLPERVAWFRSLEPEIRPKVWRQAEASRRPPAKPRRDRYGVALREDLAFLLRVIEPQELGLSRGERYELAHRVLSDLRPLLRETRRSGPLQQARAAIQALLELGGNDISRGFGRFVADALAANLAETDVERLGALHVLRCCVREHLETTRPSNGEPLSDARLLAQITLAVSRRQPRSIVLELVYSLEASRGALSFVDALIDCHATEFSQLLLVERERRRLIAGNLEVGHWCDEVPLPRYASWLEGEATARPFSLLRRAPPSPEYEEFHEHLAHEIGAIPLAQALQLGAAYLQANPRQQHLLRAVAERMRASRSALAELILQPSVGDRQPGVLSPCTALAWIIRALLADRSTDELFFSTMSSLLSPLTQTERGALLENLDAAMPRLALARRRWVLQEPEEAWNP
jgi:hypothetical protein